MSSQDGGTKPEKPTSPPDTPGTPVPPGRGAVKGAAETLAEEAAGFFYAAFVLAPEARARMLADLAALLAGMAPDGPPRFAMPVNRLVVDLA